MKEMYLSLGSNIGLKEENLQRAVELIKSRVGNVVKESSYYYSKPMGFESSNDFVNQCLLVETDMLAIDALHALQEIERMMGRKEHRLRDDRGNRIYQDRIIDIDILLYGSEEIYSAELTVPHPEMSKRDFVMIPLSEIRVGN